MTNQRSRKKRRGTKRAPAEQMSLSDVMPSSESKSTRGLLLDGLKLFLGLALTASLGLAIAFGAYHYAKSTPRFNIKKVEVEGGRRLLEADILGIAGVNIGENIFSLVPEEAEERLAANPWVAHARITRRLPGQIKVVIKEREVRALVEISRKLLLVDKEGSAFKFWTPGDPADLPIITGLSAEKMQLNPQVEEERVLAALQLLQDYSLTQQSKVAPAQEVHLDRLGHATLTIGESGVALRLGVAPWKSKLLRAAKVFQKAQRAGGESETIFLDNSAHPERVVVRLR